MSRPVETREPGETVLSPRDRAWRHDPGRLPPADLVQERIAGYGGLAATRPARHSRPAPSYHEPLGVTVPGRASGYLPSK
jgi:hypothetical protein